MKHYDLTPIEKFLKEKNLTMNEVARDIYIASHEILYSGLFCIELVKHNTLKISAESIRNVVHSLVVFATAFIDNNLQEFFEVIADPGFMSEELKKAISMYKDIVGGLLLSDGSNVDMIRLGTGYITLLHELADLCSEIDKLSQEAA